LRRAVSILKLFFLAISLLLELSYYFIKFKIIFYMIRKRNTRRFKKHLKDLPKELREQLVREYDYKLKKVLSLRVKDFARAIRRS